MTASHNFLSDKIKGKKLVSTYQMTGFVTAYDVTLNGQYFHSWTWNKFIFNVLVRRAELD